MEGIGPREKINLFNNVSFRMFEDAGSKKYALN